MRDFLSLKKEEMVALRKEYIETSKTGKLAIFFRFVMFLSLIAFAILIIPRLYLIGLIVFASGFILNLTYNFIDEYVFFKKWLLKKGIKR